MFYHIYLILTFLNHIYTFLKNHTLSFRLLFFERYTFCRKLAVFSGFRLNPYTRICVSTIGSYSTFCTQMQSHGKSPVESWVWGFSPIFDFSVYLKKSSRITFPPSGGGPLPGPYEEDRHA